MRRLLPMITVLIAVLFTSDCYAEEQQKTLVPKTVKVDSNFDGKADRFEYYDEKGQVSRVELDTTGDGRINEWVTYKDGQPLKGERDTNADGKPDIWIEY